MTRETLDYLNTQTLIGFTDKRGTAWHYRAELQNDEPNHYPAAVPVDDVNRRLFHWTAESRRLAVETAADVTSMTHLDPAGNPTAWSTPVSDWSSWLMALLSSSRNTSRPTVRVMIRGGGCSRPVLASHRIRTLLVTPGARRATEGAWRASPCTTCVTSMPAG